jgi:hypothetical protein
MRLHPCVSTSISRAGSVVRQTVEFNDELCCIAVKVCDERSKRMLPAEDQSVRSELTKSIEEDSFRGCCRLSELASTRNALLALSRERFRGFGLTFNATHRRSVIDKCGLCRSFSRRAGEGAAERRMRGLFMDVGQAANSPLTRPFGPPSPALREREVKWATLLCGSFSRGAGEGGSEADG